MAGEIACADLAAHSPITGDVGDRASSIQFVAGFRRPIRHLVENAVEITPLTTFGAPREKLGRRFGSINRHHGAQKYATQRWFTRPEERRDGEAGASTCRPRG